MITQSDAVRGIKASGDDYRYEDWFKKEKMIYHGVLKTPTQFECDITQGEWAIRSTKTQKILEVVVRGSNEFPDWFGKKGNVRLRMVRREVNQPVTFITKKVITNARYHIGWGRAAKDLEPYLFPLIKKECPTHIYIYAHSRGCPIAMIIYEKIKFLYGSKIKRKGIFFSSPRPGNQAFCDLVDNDPNGETMMIFINGDLVCAVPPWLAGFRQIKNVKGYWMFPPMLPWAHYPSNLLKCIEAKKW